MTDPATDTESAPRRANRRRLVLAAAALVTAVGAGAGALALSAHGETKAERPGSASPSAALTTVVRGDLSDSRTLTGTLGFAGPRTVKGTGKGVVTWLPDPGATVTRGKPLYRVDDRPVMVFFGDTPVFRTLVKPGVSGRDVTVLADNLQALGYDIGPRGRTSANGTEFTPSLAAALKRWQRDTGQQQTGTLDPGRVVVLPGEARVGDVKAQLGDPATGDMLTVTSATKTVGLKVDAADAAPIRVGDEVSIALPSAKTIPGKVTAVSHTVQGGGDEQDEEITGPPSLRVTVTPAHDADVKRLDSASVRVTFTAETRKNVLSVPVGALLALREGGYALQRRDGGLLAVDTGLFAKGMVEVSGKGVREGLRVVTTS
ncbi:peptidoglycan-binding protein [Streptomyces sp. NEAU-YJ-81]|uniref:peptidoglycan-binding protein n=1 Tax=Streptomyces sp. NEAU-YJ-81 TaxID=2820288 RepID=UPI001ABC9903|nr:peptidoglycan-binding protein [Streptomyces sp. NEAU-YJ-81]MBO3681415.1 peptidoglycan-binding protein [Streptomyces sp. NEAU-YJ-81]